MYDVSLEIYKINVCINSVNALVLQSSFGVTSFVSEVVFLKMPSRQEKKQALEVRDDVLESARASYKAEPEKKRTAEQWRSKGGGGGGGGLEGAWPPLRFQLVQ